MFRAVFRLSTTGARSLARSRICYSAPLASRCYSHGKVETDEEFDARWVTYFSKPDIDAWELRKGMNTLIGYDLVPEAKILDSALRACRRLNDLASAIRILEAVKRNGGVGVRFGRHCYFQHTHSHDPDPAANVVTGFGRDPVGPLDKAGPHKEIYPYLIQELKPTLSELGISTPEELGIDKL